ncbi:MAG: lysophospholipase [Bacteriovoracaceae bacterium]|nr:lysophospholipase [Bacteriovoracaceae bacterium]
MWTQPSRSTDKKSQRIKIRREIKHYKSAQPDSRFAVQSWFAVGSHPTSQILFLHGALSHGDRHSEMFEWFVKKSDGATVVRSLDFVGHGISSGPRGHVDKFKYWMDDLISALNDLSAYGSTTLIGHSMGGLIALKSLLEREQEIPKEVGPLILSNPCIRPIQVVEIPKLEMMVNGIADRLPLLRFPRIHKGPQLANNPEAANSFETDPLVSGFITAQMTREIYYASQDIRSLSYFLKRPTLFLISGQDLVVDREATLLFSRGIDKKFCKVIEYENVKHELLHEAIRHKVWQDIATWLESV